MNLFGWNELFCFIIDYLVKNYWSKGFSGVIWVYYGDKVVVLRNVFNIFRYNCKYFCFWVCWNIVLFVL